jgi:pimeloyl-ACP methyl ester carboxylesterase
MAADTGYTMIDRDSASAPARSAAPAAGGEVAMLPPLVLVHGLQGSHLERRHRGCCGRRMYMSLSRLFCGAFCCGGCGVDQFPLPTRYGADGVQDADGLESTGTLLDVRVCGCIKVASVYTPLVEQAIAAGRTVFLFHYDWRRSPAEAGARLEAFLTDVLQRYRGYTGGAQILCHSNGACVTFPVVNRRPDLVHSVVFAAGALGGGASTLHDMSEPDAPPNNQNGNRTMLQPPNLGFSWPTKFSGRKPPPPPPPRRPRAHATPASPHTSPPPGDPPPLRPVPAGGGRAGGGWRAAPPRAGRRRV